MTEFILRATEGYRTFRDAASNLEAGDEISRDGVTFKKITVVKHADNGNVQVDYEDGTIEDLDPSFYPYVRQPLPA